MMNVRSNVQLTRSKSRYLYHVIGFLLISAFIYTWYRSAYLPLRRVKKETVINIKELQDRASSDDHITEEAIEALQQKLLRAQQQKTQQLNLIDCVQKAQAHAIVLSECRWIEQSNTNGKLLHLCLQGKHKATHHFFSALLKHGPMRLVSFDYTHDATTQQCTVTCMIELRSIKEFSS